MSQEEKNKIMLERAESTALQIIEKLKPYCKKNATGEPLIKVAGSVRRRRPWVHDIDIVLIPAPVWGLPEEIKRLNGMRSPKPDGPKIKHIQIADIPVDLYIADELTWGTLLLIRTGSQLNNIRLCQVAMDKGWELHADGSGLFNQDGARIAGDSEESIYTALGLRYQKPEDRG
jgi:DNA polymerase (family 10)